MTGPDRRRYLNGQVTNDLAKLTPERAMAACVLNAKGKMDAAIFVSLDRDDFLIDADPELRETLAARLERYIIADDVTVVDATNELALLHTIGAPVPELPQARITSANRLGMEGSDIWIEAGAREALLARLGETFPLVDEESAEIFRIEQGVPRWGRELTPEILPPEANLETSAIDYGKGCYIGQEVISRMKMSGQRSKRLCRLIADNETPLRSGEHLADAEGREVGWITSAIRSERFRRDVALAFVKRGANEPGSRLQLVGQSDATVTIVDLPFRDPAR